MYRSIITSLLFVLLITSVSLNAQLPSRVGTTPLPSLAPMLEQANPAVVNIATSSVVETPLMRDPFFGTLIPRKKRQQLNSLGSGVIIDAQKGYLLTNHHVIKDADEIKITLHDGRELNARLIGSDEKTDVAVLQIKSKKLTAIPIGNSDAIRVGDFVVAIGNPFSLGHSVTSGIVSAKGRSGLGIEQYEDFIQTDAAINPGNSGGALVDLNGNLIGINTAILGPQGNIGIGFAIPINLAKTIMQHLIQYGEVRRGLLGISVQELSPALARVYGVDTRSGVIVTEVNPSSPAAKAGIQIQDIILSLNGRKLKTRSDLFNQLGLLPTGSEIEIRLIRGNKTLSIKTIIEEPEVIRENGDTYHPLLTNVILGLRVGLPSEQAGIEVLQVDRRSRAAYYGLQSGDVIVGVNRYRIRNFEEFEEALPSRRRALALNVKRNNETLLIIIR
ncbi:DegQ family serine endoprotease [Pleionea sp. CnH1-48]|uniref:DegQ family serine endoprotease n=1 Tax=Pleionea sp. CnH1-48 TaxID=2954494 RepID=UPI00209848A7|nr:DegQ family serine endoprotease [Pleionea sp. CnH1-48]MCO7224023.1 DegQ family serine endoprotease [Pleionea sp. CnH1-48]